MKIKVGYQRFPGDPGMSERSLEQNPRFLCPGLIRGRSVPALGGMKLSSPVPGWIFRGSCCTRSI